MNKKDNNHISISEWIKGNENKREVFATRLSDFLAQAVEDKKIIVDIEKKV